MLTMTNSSQSPRSVTRLAGLSRLSRVAVLFLLVSMMSLTSCGNKGDLFLPVDQETLDQLESAEQALEESADPDKKKPKKDDESE